MSNRRFTALGTGSQVPTRRRNHNGYFLHWDDRGLLFDPGEGTQRQMAYFGVAASDIHIILITHLHGDHCLGLAGILQRMSLDRVPQTVELIYPASGKQYIDNLKNASIYYNVTRLREHPVNTGGVVFEDSRFSIEAHALDHPVDCFGYRVREPDGVSMRNDALAARGIKGPDVGVLKAQGFFDTPAGRVALEEVSSRRRGMVFGFLMDTRLCDNAAVIARGADLLVSEATYLSSESAEAASHGHMTAAQAAQVARDAGVRQLALTHFSQRYQALEEFVSEAGALHPHTVVLEDGAAVALPRLDEAPLAAQVLKGPQVILGT
ncbi:MAG: Ribonuclease [Bradyrhizobium sp.]|nr:Ribonuclease [Bradyrhizobium sp.]